LLKQEGAHQSNNRVYSSVVTAAQSRSWQINHSRMLESNGDVQCRDDLPSWKCLFESNRNLRTDRQTSATNHRIHSE